MKPISILFFFSLSFAYGQTNYFVIPKASSIEMTYKMKTDSFVDCYFKPTKINEVYYSMRIRNYLGEKDTAYYREDSVNYYACSDLKNIHDYIEIPKKPRKGKIWYAYDNWTYTIISINAKLKTPNRSYYNLVAIEAKQPKEKNNQFTNYVNYYAKGIGYVGSVVNGKLYNYLIDVVEKE